jgi:two-component system NtrC family response regulator
VRLVCATHRNLEEMVRAGEFREDLLFRINTFEITVPPLRERREDIASLVGHFVRRSRPQLPSQAPVADDVTLATLAAHDWPGNIRELANVVEHALVLCDDLPLTVEHLPGRLNGLKPAALPPATVPASGIAAAANPGPLRPRTLQELELDAILTGLARNEGNKPRTAEELGISLKTLYNKLHQMQDGALDKSA